MNTPADASSDNKAGFPKTKVDLINRVGDGPDRSPSWDKAVGEFYTAYHPALTRYITWKMVASGFPPHLRDRAEDYVGDFLTEVIGKPQLCAKWEEGGRRFRNWIATPCWWYVQDRLRHESRLGRIESLNREGAPDVPDEAAERDFAERNNASDLAASRTWLFMLLLRAIELWHSRYGDWRRWRLFAKTMLLPYRSKQPPPQIKDSEPQSNDSERPIEGIYTTCGYRNAGQAYRAFEKFQRQFSGCVREVLREWLLDQAPSHPAGSAGGDDARLTARIEEEYQRYLELLDRDIKQRYDYTLDWKEGEWKAAGDAVERFLQQISGTVVQATPGDSSMPDDRGPAAPADDFGDVPDVDACTLGVMAAVLTQTTHDPTAKELEADLSELLSRPWTSIVGQTAEAAGTAECVRAVILAEEPRTEAWWKIKEAAKAARKAADGDIWEDAWSAIYYASIAAEIDAKRCLLDKPFTDLSPERQVDGLRWLARRLWVEPKICNLAVRALEQIGEKA